MKILLLADGRAVHTARFRRGMHDAGAEVLLASLEPGPEVDVRLKRKTPLNALAYYFAASEIKKLVKSFNPDIVNPHFASGYGFTVAASGVNKNKPVVLHCLGSDILISPKKSFLHRYRVVSALKGAGEIFADSQYMAGEIKRLHEESRVNVIPWGVEESILQIYLKKQNVKIDVGCPLKILVPRPHSKVYNNLFVIESLKTLLKEKKIMLTFPAWGTEYESFRKSTTGHFPEGVINFYNFQERRDYFKLLSGFDFYLSAALSDSSPASTSRCHGGRTVSNSRGYSRGKRMGE